MVMASRPQSSDGGTKFEVLDGELSIVKGGEKYLIPTLNIIAIVNKPPDSSSEYTILYTAKNPKATDGSKEPPFSLNFLEIRNVPKQVLQTFGTGEGVDWLPRQDDSRARGLLHVIVSTGSGTGLATGVWNGVVKPLLDHLGLQEHNEYHLHFTNSETSVTELTQNVILPNAKDGIAQYVLLLSGDGGIVDIVNSLLSYDRTAIYKNPTISLLPLGTGNAMANSSGITGDNTLGLSTMLRGSPRAVPLFRAKFSSGARLLVNHGQDERELHGVFDGTPAAYGAVVCSWGLHATLVADSDTAEYRKFGVERFKMAAKEALHPSDGSLPHAYKGKVAIRQRREQAWHVLPRNGHGYVLATLVSQLEAGFTISPASRCLDGSLRLVHFGQLSGQDAMDIMGKAYQGGKHVEDDRVGYEEIEGLRIDFDEDDARWRCVCLDGKIIRVEKGGWVEVHGRVEGVVDLVSWA